MQNESADVELQIFGIKIEWKRDFRSLAVKTERKCGSNTADLWQSSQVGRVEADINTFDRPISYWLSLPTLKNTLLLAILKDNVKTMYG